MAGLAVEGATLDGAEVGLRVGEDGLIAEIGPGVGAAPGDERIDGSGTALVPGLVNGHTHAAMTLFRVGGVITVIALAGMIIVLLRRERRQKQLPAIA